MPEAEDTREDAMGPGSHWSASAMEPTTEAWAQKRRLADAMRRVIGLLVRSDAPADELARAADRLEDYAEHLGTHPKLVGYEGFAEAANAGGRGAFFDQSPIIGRANPIAPPLVLEAHEAEQRVTGAVHFGPQYEGPPGCVHGGWIAAVFDEALGLVQSLGGQPGMTGTLTVKYRSPTPLGTDLRFDCRVAGRERRKTFAEGKLYAGDRLCAEAEGIFVAIGEEGFARLLALRP